MDKTKKLDQSTTPPDHDAPFQGTSHDNIEGRMNLSSGGACDGIDEYMQINPNPLENNVIRSEEEKRKMMDVALGKWPFDRDPSCVATPVAEKHNAEDVTTEVVMAEAIPTAGIKRKAETPARACDEETTPMSSQTVSKDSQKLFCSVCQVSVTSEVMLNAHFQGRKHRAKEARFNANGSTGIVSTGTNTADNSVPTLTPVSIPSSAQENRSATKTWECALCQLSLTSEIHLIGHLQGKKHKAKEGKIQAGELISNIEGFCLVQSQEMVMPSSNATATATATAAASDTDKQWYCSVCGVSASSQNNLNDHLKGKKHKAKAGVAGGIVEMKQELTEKGSGVEEGIVEMNQELTEKGSGVEEGIVEMNQESSGDVLRVEVIRELCLDEDVIPKDEQKASNPTTELYKDKKDEAKPMDDLSNPTSDGNKQGNSLRAIQDTEELEKQGDESIEYVKYWHCKMCNQGTHDEATMAAHRNSNEHQALLKKHGGGLISVVNVPKVAVETERVSEVESSA